MNPQTLSSFVLFLLVFVLADARGQEPVRFENVKRLAATAIKDKQVTFKLPGVSITKDKLIYVPAELGWFGVLESRPSKSEAQKRPEDLVSIVVGEQIEIELFRLACQKGSLTTRFWNRHLANAERLVRSKIDFVNSHDGALTKGDLRKFADLGSTSDIFKEALTNYANQNGLKMSRRFTTYKFWVTFEAKPMTGSIELMHALDWAIHQVNGTNPEELMVEIPHGSSRAVTGKYVYKFTDGHNVKRPTLVDLSESGRARVSFSGIQFVK